MYRYTDTDECQCICYQHRVLLKKYSQQKTIYIYDRKIIIIIVQIVDPRPVAQLLLSTMES